MAFKLRTVSHDDWLVMFSGENSALVPLLEAIAEAGKKLKNNTLRNASRLWSKAYRLERKHIIETEVLARHDVQSYGEYLALKTSDANFFEVLSKEIEKVEEGWNLLFCGFDGHRAPHLFIVAECGKIQYCDIEGFAVIGSGAWPAIVSLTSLQYSDRLSYGEAMYSLLAAKFSAETAAEGVGEDTVFGILSTDKEVSPIVLKDQTICDARKRWESMPRFPQDIVKQLSDEAVAFEDALKQKTA
jgi:hypothetical protein